MALPICAEFFIRTFFHIIRFLISHLNLILFVLFLVLLSFLFRRSIRLILGVIGYGINAIGVIPVISLSYDWLTPFLEAIIWGGMALSANMFFLGKVLLVPIMMVLGFSWDAMTGIIGDTTQIGEISNLIPLSIIMALLMESAIFNWFIVLFAILMNPLFLILATIFKIAGLQNICSTLNNLLIRFESILILPTSPKLLKIYFNFLKKWQKNLE